MSRGSQPRLHRSYEEIACAATPNTTTGSQMRQNALRKAEQDWRTKGRKSGLNGLKVGYTPSRLCPGPEKNETRARRSFLQDVERQVTSCVICKSLRIKSDLTATVTMCRKVVKLMLTCLTKQSPSCQDVDAARRATQLLSPT